MMKQADILEQRLQRIEESARQAWLKLTCINVPALTSEVSQISAQMNQEKDERIRSALAKSLKTSVELLENAGKLQRSLTRHIARISKIKSALDELK